MDKNYSDALEYLKTKFKEKYKHQSVEDTVIFYLPDGSTMKIVPLSFGNDICFVMNYKGNGYDDDGDQYYLSDYSSEDELFSAMLAETLIPLDN